MGFISSGKWSHSSGRFLIRERYYYYGKWYNVNEVDKIKGGKVLAKHIKYSIQPTDSVVEIAKRFGVDLHELVKLNPQICTPGPQAGIEIKIPMGDGPAKRLFFRLLELYRDEASNVFAMLYQIAEVSHNTEIGLEATIDNAVSHFEAGYIAGAFDCLGITKNPSVMYLEYANPITKPQKRLAELKEIRRTYQAVVEQNKTIKQA